MLKIGDVVKYKNGLIFYNGKLIVQEIHKKYIMLISTASPNIMFSVQKGEVEKVSDGNE